MILIKCCYRYRRELHTNCELIALLETGALYLETNTAGELYYVVNLAIYKTINILRNK